MSTVPPVFKPAGSAAQPATVGTPPVTAPVPASPAAAEATARLQSGTACSTSWSAEEQATLEASMFRFPAEKHQPLERYVRIAAVLSKKSVRDVAFRIKWMTVSQAARKRQLADSESSKQRQQQQFRRERGQSIFNIQPKLPMPHMAMYAPHPGGQLNAHFDDHGSATVGVVGGPIAQLLEQNYAVLNQFKRNMAQYKVSENTDLLARFRDNILAILHQMQTMQGVMQQMPPLPVRMNIEVAQNFLPKCAGAPTFPMGMPFMPPPIPGVMPGMQPGMGVNGFMGALRVPPGMQPVASSPPGEAVPGSASAHMPMQQQQLLQPQPFQQQGSMPQAVAHVQVQVQQQQQPLAGPGSMFPAQIPGMGVPMPGSMPQALTAAAPPLANGQLGTMMPQMRPTTLQPGIQHSFPTLGPGMLPGALAAIPGVPGVPGSSPFAVNGMAVATAATAVAPAAPPGSMQPASNPLSLPCEGDFAVFGLANGAALASAPFDFGLSQPLQQPLQPHAEHVHVPSCEPSHSHPIAIKAE